MNQWVDIFWTQSWKFNQNRYKAKLMLVCFDIVTRTYLYTEQSFHCDVRGKRHTRNWCNIRGKKTNAGLMISSSWNVGTKAEAWVCSITDFIFYGGKIQVRKWDLTFVFKIIDWISVEDWIAIAMNGCRDNIHWEWFW